jgi:hypothetical protein
MPPKPSAQRSGRQDLPALVLFADHPKKWFLGPRLGLFHQTEAQILDANFGYRAAFLQKFVSALQTILVRPETVNS